MNKRKEGISEIHINIRKILKGRKKGLKAYEICHYYFARFDKLYSDSTMTARMREMRDVRCDSTGNSYRYKLEGK